MHSIVDGIMFLRNKRSSSHGKTEEQINKLDNVKYLFSDKDKLARYNENNVILNNLEINKDIFIMNETGHFPFFEDPEQLDKVLSNILKS